jgi:hypothetical protein
VEAGAFDSISCLRAVRVDSNKLTSIQDLFSGVSELIWLNVSDNKVQPVRLL